MARAPGPRRRRISPANVAEFDPIELLALAVGHPIADDHRRRPVVFGHLAPVRDEEISGGGLRTTATTRKRDGGRQPTHVSDDECVGGRWRRWWQGQQWLWRRRSFVIPEKKWSLAILTATNASGRNNGMTTAAAASAAATTTTPSSTTTTAAVINNVRRPSTARRHVARVRRPIPDIDPSSVRAPRPTFSLLSPTSPPSHPTPLIAKRVILRRTYDYDNNNK